MYHLLIYFPLGRIETTMNVFFFNSQSSIYDVLYDRSVHSTSYFAAKQPTGVSVSQTLLDTLLNNRPIHIAYRIHNHFWLKTIFHLLWIIFQTSILHLTNVRQQDSGLPNSFGHQTSAFLFNLLTSLVRYISKRDVEAYKLRLHKHFVTQKQINSSTDKQTVILLKQRI